MEPVEDGESYCLTEFARSNTSFPRRPLTSEEEKLEDEFKDFKKINVDQFPTIKKFIEKEISRADRGEYSLEEEKTLDIERNDGIRKVFKVPLRWRKYRNQFNLIGRVLGPKGETLRQLQKVSRCRISILGKGSIKDPLKEEELRKKGGIYHHLNEPLHLWIQATGTPASVFAKLHIACSHIEQILSVDDDDALFAKQMEMLSHEEKEQKSKDMPRGIKSGRRGAFRGAGILGRKHHRSHFIDDEDDYDEFDISDGSRGSFRRSGRVRNGMLNSGIMRERSLRGQTRRTTWDLEPQLVEGQEWTPEQWWNSQWGAHQWSYPGFQWGMDAQWGYWPQNYNYTANYNQALAAVYSQYPAPTTDQATSNQATVPTATSSATSATVTAGALPVTNDILQTENSTQSVTAKQPGKAEIPNMPQYPDLRPFPSRSRTPDNLSEFSESELLLDTDPAWLDEEADADGPPSTDSSTRMDMSPIQEPGLLEVHHPSTQPQPLLQTNEHFRQQLVQGSDKFQRSNIPEPSPTPPLLPIKEEKRDDGYHDYNFHPVSLTTDSQPYQSRGEGHEERIQNVVNPSGGSWSPSAVYTTPIVPRKKAPLLPSPRSPPTIPKDQINHAQLEFIQAKIKEEMNKNMNNALYNNRNTTHKRPISQETPHQGRSDHPPKVFRRY